MTGGATSVAIIGRYLLYLARWQLSTPVLALWLYLFHLGGTAFSTIMANLMGGLLFFRVDRYLFKSEWFEVWQVTEGRCHECGEAFEVLFRLIRAPAYNRLYSMPAFLCIECSKRTIAALRARGIPVKGRSR